MSSSSKQINLLIISDSEHFNKRFRGIKNNDLFSILGTIKNPTDLSSNADQVKHTDIIILDVELPVEKIIELNTIIKTINQHSELVYVLNSGNNVSIPLKAGIPGCFSESDADEYIVDTLINVQKGNCFYSPSVLTHILELFSPSNNKKYNLTAKEVEILGLLIEGNKKKAIAIKLGRSFGTVDTHIKNIYRKLNVNSGIQAVALAIRERLV